MSVRLPAALACAALIGWAGAQTLAWRSAIGMVPATGAVAALADGALRGETPGREPAGRFIAAYYLPPFPWMVAAARATGLPWRSAVRASSLAASLLLLGALGLAVAAAGGGRGSVALGLALGASQFFFRDASLNGRADPLAVAFALGALAAWERDPELRGWGSPALAALSWLTKTTSVALPLAVLAVAIPRRQWGALLRFGVRFVAAVVIVQLVTLPIHGPAWWLESVRALFANTPSTWNPLRGPAELVRYFGVLPELVVAAAFAVVAVPATRRPAVPAFAATSLVLALGLMTNFGAGPNHLLEPALALVILAAVWAAPRFAAREWVPALLVSLAVLGSTWRDLLPVIRHRDDSSNVRANVLAVLRSETGPVWTEDAMLSLEAGHAPAVSDPGALRAMSLAGQPRALRVIERVENRRFRAVVLNSSLEEGAHWYHTVHLGDSVVAALRRRYVESERLDGYVLYRPRP